MIQTKTILGLLQALDPTIIGFRWEMCGDGLDAAESYGNLFILLPGGREMEKLEFQRYSLTREIMETLENVMYHARLGPTVV